MKYSKGRCKKNRPASRLHQFGHCDINVFALNSFVANCRRRNSPASMVDFIKKSDSDRKVFETKHAIVHALIQLQYLDTFEQQNGEGKTIGISLRKLVYFNSPAENIETLNFSDITLQINIITGQTL